MKSSLNDDIFEMVKSSLMGKGIDGTLFAKICTGNANEEEKTSFSKSVGIEEESKEDVIKNLVDSCNLGFKMALQMDGEVQTEKPKTEELNKRISVLEERNRVFERRIQNLEKTVSSLLSILSIDEKTQEEYGGKPVEKEERQEEEDIFQNHHC